MRPSRNSSLRQFAIIRVASLLAIVLAVFAGTSGAVRAQGAGDRDIVTVNIPKFWPPHYIAEDGAKPTGFAVDIFDAVAARAGYRVNYQIRENFKIAMDELYDGRVDAIPNIGIIPSRRERLLFTDPLETFIVSLYIRADTQGVGGLDDLRGKRVGTVARNVGNVILRDYPQIMPVVFNDIRSAVFELLAGRIDGLIYPVPVITNLARDIGISSRLMPVGPPLREIKRGIGVHPSRVEIHQRLSAAVKNFVNTKEYQEIYAKYFGEKPAGWSESNVLIAGGSSLAVLILLFSGWHYMTVMRLNRELERRVDRRTGELHDAQAELVRSARLATLGQLTGTMAHELRNPLGAVVSSFEVIKHSTEKPDHDIGPSLDRAERNIARCTTIINELLDYAQVRPVSFAGVDADQLVGSILDEYEPPPFVAVERDFRSGGRTFDADAEQLRRVIVNLLDNGRDAIAERMERDDAFTGGVLHVSIRPAGNGVEITVADNGIGIDPEAATRIFEPLFSSKPFGVGLGLPHAQNIVDQHGGTMEVRPAPGGGTQILVWIPDSQKSDVQRDAGSRERSEVV